MKSLRRVSLSFWYLLAVYALLLGIGALSSTWSSLAWMPGVTGVFGLILLFLTFVLLHLVFRELMAAAPRPSYVPPRPGTTGEGFPSPTTIGTGIWLLILTGASIMALLWSFSPPPWLTRGMPELFTPSKEAQEALVMMFAAAIGSMITTILGYLDHVSYRQDFDRAFVPWYVGRPVMGMLLGLVFYFILKGGLWTVTPPTQAPLKELNLPGLAGIGALVGLFSRNAVEKLREFFQGIFRTEQEMAQKLMDSLPKELREQVMPHWQRLLGEAAQRTGQRPTQGASGPSPVPTPKPSGRPQP
ncbi:MAG TPA: hypothetical protein VLT62_18280 [Candidatus Methylomirabilis sp.]|nr:hypothetical protein [Candidatus Methylomirabilis sp.]